MLEEEDIQIVIEVNPNKVNQLSGKKRKHPGSVKKKINEKQSNTVDENANELHSSKEISKTPNEFAKCGNSVDHRSQAV